MIFATVGTQLAFPRLIGALDMIAGRTGLEIVAQTCDPDLRPRHIDGRPQLAPAAFDRLFGQAELVIGHAGIGTILAARKFARPLLLLPRRARLGEHRNDHQLATARFVEGFPGIRIAWDERALEALILADAPAAAQPGDGASRAQLLARVRAFIAAG